MKKYYAFLVCLVISAGIWTVHYLSQTFSDVVSVQVIASSNLDGYAVMSTSPVTLSARCRTTGFRLIPLVRNNRRPRIVKFDASDFQKEGEGLFSIPSSYIFKYSEQIFGPGVSLENLVSQNAVFHFASENSRKVPVRPVQTMLFRQQYMPVGEMKTTPDSVVIYGEPELISAIDKVLTQPISLSDIHADVNGMIRLENLHGVRISATEVSYTQSVSRYVEISSEIRIEVRNVPSGRKFNIYPTTAKVVFNCSFPLLQDPLETAKLYVDYSDFSNSLSGKCIIGVEGLPKGVLNYKVLPELCECFEVVD